MDLQPEAEGPEESATNVDPVTEKLEFSASSQNPFLNISQLKVKSFPDVLLNLTHLQFLYMAFNGLKELPNDFFSALPNIKWLDLRGNRLKGLPSVDLISHNFLEYLLIEDNCISQLPIELGYLKSLRGLALSGNPLEFPHAEVVAGGAKAIKAYLREVHEGRMEIEGRLAAENAPGGDAPAGWPDDNGSCEPDEQLLNSSGTGSKRLPTESWNKVVPSAPQLYHHQQQQQESQELFTTQTAPLHRQQGQQIRQRAAPRQPAQWPKKPAALARQSDRHNQLVHPNPEPPGPGLAERRAVEERRDARRRETLDKQEAVLQRRRDAEATRQWREESRRLQMARAHEQLLKGPLAATRESESRIRGAPFNAGWDRSLMELPNQAEVDRQRWEGGGVRPEPRPEPLSAEVQVQLERQRRQREVEIAQQVQQHTTALMERRRLAQGAEGQQRMTAAQAVEAARRDVEIAMAMQRELQLRRAQLENGGLALSLMAAENFAAAAQPQQPNHAGVRQASNKRR